MRQSIAALALVRKVDPNGTARWLVNWNEKWQRLNFVGGHKRETESFKECCAREIEEETGLHEGTDFRIGTTASHRLEYDAFSHGSGETTHYTMELFDVELVGDDSRQRLDADSSCAWVDESEIRARRTADGREVSETVGLLIEKAGLI